MDLRAQVGENAGWDEGNGKEKCTAMLRAAAMPQSLVDLVNSHPARVDSRPATMSSHPIRANVDAMLACY